MNVGRRYRNIRRRLIDGVGRSWKVWLRGLFDHANRTCNIQALVKKIVTAEVAETAEQDS